MTRPVLRILLVLVALALHGSASACMWDRDTLASEAKGIPDEIRVITGRFERNPPLYYAMRLKRVTAELRLNPVKLELYDDAGVASDRLGRSDEAIAWMEKKRQQLEWSKQPNAKLREHWYRYYANVGTFWAHRWLRSGANRKKIGELKKARDLIAAAIKLNPNAHFGREKYQLKAMQWLISPPKVTPQDNELPNLLRVDHGMEAGSAREAVKGLAGLIVLGNAWESVDIFNAFAKAIQWDDRRSSPAFMARLRAAELIDAGQKSMIPGAPTGINLKTLVIGDGSTHFLEDDKVKEVESVYKNLRGEADAWQAQRTAYMMKRLKAGQHPDTDAGFWRNYRELTPPEIYGTPWWQTKGLSLLAIAVTALASLLLLFKMRHVRQHKISTP